MAAMPSFGRIKRAFGYRCRLRPRSALLSASARRPNEVWLWACHGPDGQRAPNLGTRADAGAERQLSASTTAPTSRTRCTLNAASGRRAPSSCRRRSPRRDRLGRTVALTRASVTASTTGPAHDARDPRRRRRPADRAQTTATRPATSAGPHASTGAGAGGVDVSHVAMRSPTSRRRPARSAAGVARVRSRRQGHARRSADAQLDVRRATSASASSATAYLDGVPSPAARRRRLVRRASPSPATSTCRYGAVGQTATTRRSPCGCANRGEVTLAGRRPRRSADADRRPHDHGRHGVTDCGRQHDDS